MKSQIHDKYGKKLLREIVGFRFIDKGRLVEVDYGGGITNDCAIEIQVLDLLEHPYPKKFSSQSYS